MTDPNPKLVDSLPEEDRRLYSINLLVARFDHIKDLRRDEEVLHNKLPSRHYQNRDFSTKRFFKSISTPLGRLEAVSRKDD